MLSGLERLRIAREQREAEVVEPLKKDIQRHQRNAHVFRSESEERGKLISAMARATGTKAFEHMEQMRFTEMATRLMPIIMEALPKLHRSEPVTIRLGPEFAFVNPRSLERMVWDRYCQELVSRLELSIDPLGGEASFRSERIRVEIPKLVFEFEVAVVR